MSGYKQPTGGLSVRERLRRAESLANIAAADSADSFKRAEQLARQVARLEAEIVALKSAEPQPCEGTTNSDSASSQLVVPSCEGCRQKDYAIQHVLDAIDEGEDIDTGRLIAALAAGEKP